MVAKETCATKLWAGWLAAVQVNVEFVFAVLVGVRVASAPLGKWITYLAVYWHNNLNFR